MNNSATLKTVFCKKCKKIRTCLDTRNVSKKYVYMCKECCKQEHVLSTCIGCGREGIRVELEKYG
ncbi:MAG: hypothetical protein RSD47_10815 [Romboutsia sp.]